jgi:uncharacterized protein (TIGR04255 family)
MEVTFRNAPLVETVAEVRWQSAQGGVSIPQPAALSQPAISVVVGTTDLENFYTQFGGEIFERGFARSERIVPVGVPALQGQAVMRFRSSLPEKATVLYHVGPGIFSANALPPYRSWNHFAPDVETGLDVLLAVRNTNEKERQFNPISLRYLNAFRPELTEGADTAEFISAVLKFDVDLPDAVLSRRNPDKPVQPFIAMAIPITAGLLRVNVGEAVVAGVGKAALLDMTLSTEHPIEPTKSAVMHYFHSAHSVLHDMFLELTKSIHHLMSPEQ